MKRITPLLALVAVVACSDSLTPTAEHVAGDYAHDVVGFDENSRHSQQVVPSLVSPPPPR